MNCEETRHRVSERTKHVHVVNTLRARHSSRHDHEHENQAVCICLVAGELTTVGAFMMARLYPYCRVPPMAAEATISTSTRPLPCQVEPAD